MCKKGAKIRQTIFGESSTSTFEIKAIKCCKTRLFELFSNTVVYIFRSCNKYYIEMHDERVISKKYTYKNA